MLVNDAAPPEGDFNPMIASTMARMMSEIIAMILISANQNSSSPNILTVRRFKQRSRKSVAAASKVARLWFLIQKSQ